MKLRNCYLNVSTEKVFTKKQFFWRNTTKRWMNNLPCRLKRLTPWVERLNLQLMVEKMTSDATSDFSESMAWSVVEFNASNTNSNLWWGVDSGTTNSLVPNTTPLTSPSPSALLLRTSKNEKITSTSKGKANVLGLQSWTAHNIEGMAEPFLSVSKITNQDIKWFFSKPRCSFSIKQSNLKDTWRDPSQSSFKEVKSSGHTNWKP